MMKRKNLLFRGLLAVAAVPMLMASCNSDEPRPEINQYVTIGRVGVGEMETRAGYDATNNFLPTSSTDSLTLFVKSSLSDPQYSRDYLQFTCDGSKWSTKTPLAWGGNTAKWSAFYGTTYQDVFYDSSTEKYNLRYINIEDPHRDILYAYGTTSTGSLSINFKHLTAKLRYNIHIISGPDPIENLRGIMKRDYSKVNEINIGEEITIAPEYEWDCYLFFKDHPELKVTPTNGATYSYEYLVLPMKTNKYEQRFYIGGTYSELYSNIEDVTIESNKSYVFDVYIADGKILKADVTIKAWEDIENAANLETK